MTRTKDRKYTSVEICAGAGGQAVGLHNAGFKHVALIEIDKYACETLTANTESNPEWEACRVIEADLREFDPDALGLEPGVLDLLAGGVPCPLSRQQVSNSVVTTSETSSRGCWSSWITLSPRL